MTLRIAIICCLSVFSFACGEEIGDECSISTDCASDGTRTCDVSSPGGYCTIRGCDVGTCPDEAVCVRFYPGTSSSQPCDPATEDRTTDVCGGDEVCTFSGNCAPRNSEIRYCMKTCDGNGDCRGDYECRDAELMKANGGEPVPESGEPTGSKLNNFCASSPL